MEFEKLGAFYLGREYDLDTSKILDRPVLYDSRDLTTHAVCVGMTGSGKTGLCISLLEEAAIDGVPAIIIDPKGDIANLLLTFPALRPSDFLPWVNADDARRQGLTEEQFASRQADLWKKGLGRWGQDGSRIALLKDAADFVVFTPGSDAGVPVSILRSFSPPDLDWTTEAEAVRERIGGTVSALLTLIGLEADPLRSREHILLSTLFEHFWREGTGFGLPALIMAVQNPPVPKLGVFDTDTFFPPKERFEFAMTLNGLVAAPGFQSWLQGQPLDIPSFLASPGGKCRHAIFSLAHLGDAERMFFVTLLLNGIVSWMRTQPGTTSLRAILYMDEILGYFPPVANPPSKPPLLALLKQARAFGVGVVLATQNPADLDYKGLSNAGTWFIGRLQTERDRDRLLGGLAASAPGHEGGTLAKRISGLTSRVFLLHDVHGDGPVAFHTRWALSYLRGPLTKAQIRTLTAGRSPDPPRPAAAGPGAPPHPSVQPPPGTPAVAATSPPQLPPDIRQGFIAPRLTAATAGLRVREESGGALDPVAFHLHYRPSIMATGRVHFIDRRRRVDEEERFGLLAPPPRLSGALRWEDAVPVDAGAEGLSSLPEPGASFDPLPDSLDELKEFRDLERDLGDHLYRSRTLDLLSCPPAGITSRPFEDEREFILRVRQELRERRDREVEKLKRSYAKRLRTLENRRRRAEETLAKRETVAKSRKGEVIVSFGESLLGVLMGRRSTRAASTTIGKYRQSRTAEMSVEEALEAVEASRREIAAIDEELREKAAEITRRWEDSEGHLEKTPVTPRRGDVEIDFFGLAWAPWWIVTVRDVAGRSEAREVRAF